MLTNNIESSTTSSSSTSSSSLSTLATQPCSLMRILIMFSILLRLTAAYPRDINAIVRDIFHTPNANATYHNYILNGYGNTDEAKVTKLPILQRPNRTPIDEANNENCLNDVESGKTFCTHVEDYPDLTQLKKKLKSDYRSFFHEDIVVPRNISPRFGGGYAEELLCGSSERVIYPRKAQAADANWHYIVNDDELKQGVRVEECRNEGRACDYMQNLPNDYQSTCKQNYAFRLMVAIAQNGTRIIEEQFKFPSCCKCVVTHKYDF